MAQVPSGNRQGLILSGDLYIICGRVPQFIVRMLVSAINLFLFISTYALPQHAHSPRPRLIPQLLLRVRNYKQLK